jgi:hypothetical protein
MQLIQPAFGSLHEVNVKAIGDQSDLIGWILTFAGLMVSIVALEGLARVVAIALVVLSSLLIHAIIRGRWLMFWSGSAATLVVFVAALVGIYYFASELMLETIQTDRGSGFAAVEGERNHFSQESAEASRTMPLKLGFRDVDSSVHYLRRIELCVKRYQPADGNHHQFMAFRISVVFTSPPSDDDIVSVETRFGIHASTRVGRIATFESDDGISDSTIELIRKCDGVEQVSITNVGTGQSPVNFVVSSLAPALAQPGDRTSSDLNVEIPKDGTGGIIARIDFAKPGEFWIQGNLQYGNRTLAIPVFRVSVLH